VSVAGRRCSAAFTHFDTGEIRNWAVSTRTMFAELYAVRRHHTSLRRAARALL
jgi:hypothetical protein